MTEVGVERAEIFLNDRESGGIGEADAGGMSSAVLAEGKEVGEGGGRGGGGGESN